MKHIVITGFMGTGKTTVGQALAQRLERPFVDMDAEIEAQAGKSIPRIFAEDGEATFRQLESALCEALHAQQGLVIATGGGTLVNPANRALMMQSGTVICLTCDVDTMLARLRGKGTLERPLLNVADPKAEAERLLAARRSAYQAIPWQVDTSGLPVDTVVEQVLALSEFITLPVRCPGEGNSIVATPPPSPLPDLGEGERVPPSACGGTEGGKLPSTSRVPPSNSPHRGENNTSPPTGGTCPGLEKCAEVGLGTKGGRVPPSACGGTEGGKLPSKIKTPPPNPLPACGEGEQTRPPANGGTEEGKLPSASGGGTCGGAAKVPRRSRAKLIEGAKLPSASGGTEGGKRGKKYHIHIGEGALTHLGAILRAAGMPQGSRVAVVSNPVVAPLYGAQVTTALRATGFQPFNCNIPDGEAHKTLDTVATLYEQFLAGRLTRNDTVLSLGGGVTGDIAGFAAATFMRGVRFVQVPTTLLAMVDASVGGKTGVDLPQGKNLVGAFKQPATVIIDPAMLTTLPAEELRAGMAEVIKHAIIDDPELFTMLHDSQQPLTAALIARALRVKIAIVEQDPYEGGLRAVLNLGHTVGHALERLSDFTLRHGEAISIGLVAAARIAAALDMTAPSLATRIAETLVAWDLPVRCPSFSTEAIWAAMAHDKKRRGQTLRWVLPRDIGKVNIVDDVPQSVVRSILETLGARSDTL